MTRIAPRDMRIGDVIRVIDGYLGRVDRHGKHGVRYVLIEPAKGAGLCYYDKGTWHLVSRPEPHSWDWSSKAKNFACTRCNLTIMDRRSWLFECGGAP